MSKNHLLTDLSDDLNQKLDKIICDGNNKIAKLINLNRNEHAIYDLEYPLPISNDKFEQSVQLMKRQDQKS